MRAGCKRFAAPRTRATKSRDATRTARISLVFQGLKVPSTSAQAQKQACRNTGRGTIGGSSFESFNSLKLEHTLVSSHMV